MPLGLKSAETINALGTEMYVEFLNATGVYDVDDNPGGFGTPNPDRNQVAIVMFAEHKKVAGDVAASIQGYNALSVESFTIDITKSVNGVCNYVIFSILIFDPGTVYENGDVRYDTTNASAHFIKEMVDDEWVERTPEELIDNEEVVQLNKFAFPISSAIEFERSLNAIKMKVLRRFVNCECEKEEYEPKRNDFEYVAGLLQSATNAFCTQAYNEAQIDIEKIFEFEESLVNE